MGNELSRSLFVIGAFEANEFAFLDQYLKPGMVFVDAGAHEGLYSVFAAIRTAPGGRVLAIEPSARERAICEANLELNSCAATVIPCALAAADGEAEFLLAQDHRSGHNTLGAFAWGGVHIASRQTVSVRSLDSLAAEYGLERLDVLKMDIEGAETQALRGGVRVFGELRPVVIVEVSPRSLEAQGSSQEELLATFEELGLLIKNGGRPRIQVDKTNLGESFDQLRDSDRTARLPDYRDGEERRAIVDHGTLPGRSPVPGMRQ